MGRPAWCQASRSHRQGWKRLERRALRIVGPWLVFVIAFLASGSLLAPVAGWPAAQKYLHPINVLEGTLGAPVPDGASGGHVAGLIACAIVLYLSLSLVPRQRPCPKCGAKIAVDAGYGRRCGVCSARWRRPIQAVTSDAVNRSREAESDYFTAVPRITVL